MSVRPPSGPGGQGSQGAVPPAAFDAEDASTYAFATPVNLIDAEGRPREAMVYFVQTDVPDPADPATRYQMRLVVDGAESVPAGGVQPAARVRRRWRASGRQRDGCIFLLRLGPDA